MLLQTIAVIMLAVGLATVASRGRSEDRKPFGPQEPRGTLAAAIDIDPLMKVGVAVVVGILIVGCASGWVGVCACSCVCMGVNV